MHTITIEIFLNTWTLSLRAHTQGFSYRSDPNKNIIYLISGKCPY